MDKQRLRCLSLEEIVHQSRVEQEKFAHQQPHDSSYIMELFRRACERDALSESEAAWTALYEQFFPLILTWIHSTVSGRRFIEEEGSDALITQAFERFALALTAEKLRHFETVGQVITYWQKCTRTMVVDLVISRSAKMRSIYATVSYESLAEEHDTEFVMLPDIADAVTNAMVAENFWQHFKQWMSDEEYLVLLLLFRYRWTPGDICHCYPHLFATAFDVYQTKRNVLDRLKRNRRLRYHLREYVEYVA